MLICKLKVSSSPSPSSCSHPKFLEGRCTVCGTDDQGLCSAAFPFEYICKSLRISAKEVNRIRESEFLSIKSGKKQKLFLVLDLDHTLLHTVSIRHLSPSDQRSLPLLFNSSSKCTDSKTFFLSRKDDQVTKLRPFVGPFLKQASELFDLCIFTMGGRSYAKRMARLLDPDHRLFGLRVISRQDCREKKKKSLDLVLAKENAVVIVDDTPSVWGKHWTNLITVDKYNYFSESKAQVANRLCGGMAPVMDETEADDELLVVLDILKDVHKRFFTDPAMRMDVRQVLEAIRQELDKEEDAREPSHMITDC